MPRRPDSAQPASFMDRNKLPSTLNAGPHVTERRTLGKSSSSFPDARRCGSVAQSRNGHAEQEGRGVPPAFAPASGKVNGCEARVHCTTTTGATATLSATALNTSFNKSLTTVQKLDGSGNDDGSASVIGDATFNDVTGAITSTVARTLKLFRVTGGNWTYIQDLTQGVII